MFLRKSVLTIIQISLQTPVLFVVFALLASVLSVLSPLLPKHLSKLTRSLRVLISTHPSLVPVSKNSARISSAVLLNLLRRSSATRRLTSRTSMKSSWSVVPLVFPVSSNLFPTSSTARSPTRASTPMRPSPMVLQSRLLSSLVTPLRRHKIFFSSTLPLFPLVSRLPGVSWPLSSSVTPLFPPKSLKSSPLILTTSPVCLFKCTKESVLAPRITTCLGSLSCLAFLLLLVVFLKLKLPLTLMPTVSWMSLLRTRLPESPTALRSLTTRVVSLRRRLTVWLRKLRNIKV